MSRIAVGLRWWRARCGVPWAIFISIVSGLGVVFGSIWVAAPIVAEWRFWASRSEIRTVAERVYPRTIADQERITFSLESRLEWLKTRAATGKLEPVQWGEIAVTEDAIKKSKKEVEKIIREEAEIRGEQEHR